jgi:hypothetical protein
MTGDRHVRFCESGRGRIPPATHHGCLWVLVAATSLGLQALTTPSEHGLKFVDNLFGGIGL